MFGQFDSCPHFGFFSHSSPPLFVLTQVMMSWILVLGEINARQWMVLWCGCTCFQILYVCIRRNLNSYPVVHSESVHEVHVVCLEVFRANMLEILDTVLSI